MSTVNENYYHLGQITYNLFISYDISLIPWHLIPDDLCNSYASGIYACKMQLLDHT